MNAKNEMTTKVDAAASALRECLALDEKSTKFFMLGFLAGSENKEQKEAS